MKKRNGVLGLLAAVLASMVSGCSTSGVRPQISTFQSASAVVVSSARDEFTSINKFVRDDYIDRQLEKAHAYLADTNATVNPITEAQGYFNSTTLAAHEVLSPEALNARLDALNALTRYGELLNSLANSDADARIAQQANDLAASLTNLNGTLGSIGVLDANQSTAFKASLGAFTTAFVPIATAIVHHKIQKAIDSAVTKADPEVSKLIAAIRNDLHFEVAKRARKLKDDVADATSHYLDLLQTKAGTAKDLTAAVDQMKAKLDVLAAFSTVTPDNALDAMASAEKALVNYTKSKKTAADLAAFAAAMDSFAGQAKILAAAILDVRAATDALKETHAKSKK